MGNYNRNDISIYITDMGDMVIAQGGPAQENMDHRDGRSVCVMDTESALYFSQLRHRDAWITADGEYHIGTPTERMAADDVVDFENFGGYRAEAGSPYFCHRLASV